MRRRAIIAPTFKASPWRRGGFCRRAGTVPRTGVWHQPGPGIGLLLVSLLVLAGLIAAAAGPLSNAPAAPLDRVLPDLVSDPPEGPVLQIYDYGSGDNHLLLRFNGYVHNRGSGALEMRGSQPSGNRMASVAQRIRLVGGTYVDDTSRGAQIIYEDADGHDHWHLKDVSRYTLWNQAKTAAVAPSMKVGFCLEDGERRERNGPATKVYTSALTSFCRNWEPQADSVYQGVSAGWRDIYFKTVAFQWVDVSDVPPGVYRLGSRIDPQNVVIESNESNNGDGFAASASTIPGYVAGPVAPPPATLGQPTTIQLSATMFGSPGARRFRAESAPKHGTINRAVGETFTASQLVYTPDPGYKGPDDFEYSALDSTSAFPVNPVRAVVSLSAGHPPPSVQISRAPKAIVAGTSVELLATVLWENQEASWSVDGKPGGDADSGTISPAGLYVAPDVVPPSGSVTVRASTPSGASDEVTIKILPPPVPEPAPSADPLGGNPADPPGGYPVRAFDKNTNPLGPLHVERYGRLLVVSLRAHRSGVVRVTVDLGKRRIGWCRMKTPKDGNLTCRIRVGKSLILRRMKVTASLRAKGKLIGIRRSSVRAAAHAHHHH